MNKLIQMGRLTKEPDIKTTSAGMIARFSVAVDKTYKKGEADFFNYTAFGKKAEFVEKYLHQGTKVVITGRVENDNYERDGRKVYGFAFIADEIEFAESKKAQEKPEDGFAKVPDTVDDDNLPFE